MHPLDDRRTCAPKPLLAAACAAAALLPWHALAQSSYVLYGVVDAGVELTTSAQGNEKRVISGGLMGSRWGLSGIEDLGAGLRTLFRLEGGFNAADGSLSQGGRAFGRESSVGLSSSTYGTVLAGRLPTPYYRAQSAVDAFGYGNPGSVVAATRIVDGAARQLLPAAVNARADKSVGYTTPVWGGFAFSALASANEQSPTLGRAYGLSARYATRQATAVAAWNRQKSGSTGTGDAEAYVLGGSYDFGAARVFVGYTVEKNGCSNCTGIFARMGGVTGTDESEFRLANIGARVPMGGALTLIAQYTRLADRSRYATPRGRQDANWVSVGAEYLLSTRTTLYGGVGTIGNRNGSSYALGTGSAQQPSGLAVDPSRSTTVAAGIRHRF